MDLDLKDIEEKVEVTSLDFFDGKLKDDAHDQAALDASLAKLPGVA